MFAQAIILISRSWNYWFDRATSNGDMAACHLWFTVHGSGLMVQG